MITFGYEQRNAYHIMFTKYLNSKITIFIVYADNIVMTSDNKKEITRMTRLKETFDYYV